MPLSPVRIPLRLLWRCNGDGSHFQAFMDAVTGVKNDLLAFLQPVEHLGLNSARAARFDHAQARPPVLQDEGGPMIAAAEQGAGRRFEGVVCLPNDNARFDSEIIPQ